jgi:hypothetical protein
VSTGRRGRAPVLLGLLAAVLVLMTVGAAPAFATNPPVITLNGDNPMTVEAGDSYVEPGATASDVEDGDISGGIVIDASAVNTAVPGSYPVTYDVTDSNGNPATQVIRTVDVVDTTAAVITVPDAGPLTHEAGTAFTDPGATATDAVDGVVPLTSSTPVDGFTVGVYTLTYDYTDGAGNSSTRVTVTVNVVDTTPAVITVPMPRSVDPMRRGRRSLIRGRRRPTRSTGWCRWVRRRW